VSVRKYIKQGITVGLLNSVKKWVGVGVKKEAPKKQSSIPKSVKIVPKPVHKPKKKFKPKKVFKKPAKPLPKKFVKPKKERVKHIKEKRVKKILKKITKISKKPKKEKEKEKFERIIPPLDKVQALKLLKFPEAEDVVMNQTGAGEEGLKIYKYLVNLFKEVDEFTLADKVDLQINFVRSLLYKLYDLKLVSFSRERDKKKGWFIYSWQSHPDRLKYILIKKKEDQVEKLKQELEATKDSFYCDACNRTFDYGKAMETMFFCDNCGGQLKTMNSVEIKNKITAEINKLEGEKKLIEEI
jgi:transcription initiation factor TFIIE subunit alpha